MTTEAPMDPAQTTGRRRKGRPKSFASDAAGSTIQSLDRAFAVLERLALRGGMSLSEVAEDLDQSPATIYRVLRTLEMRGVVDLTRVNGIGPATVDRMRDQIKFEE